MLKKYFKKVLGKGFNSLIKMNGKKYGQEILILILLKIKLDG